MVHEQKALWWKGVPAIIGILTSFVLCIAFAIRADSKADSAYATGVEAKTQGRENEKRIADMAGDIKVMRNILERLERVERTNKP